MKYQKLLVKDCKDNKLSEEEIKFLLHDMLKNFMIEVDELKQLYALFGYPWSDEFNHLTIGQLKHLNDPYWLYIDVEKETSERKIKFDLNYYKYLVNRAKTSKEYTKKLVEYVIGVDDIAFKYYALGQIKTKYCYGLVKDIDWELIDSYVDERRAYTLRDLFAWYIKDYNVSSNETEMFRDASELIIPFMEKLLKFKTEGNFRNQFIYQIETILALINEKLANSIKVNFCILDKNMLDESEYDLNKGKLKSILNNLYKDIDKDYTDELREIFEKNEKKISTWYIGYTSFANALLKEV